MTDQLIARRIDSDDFFSAVRDMPARERPLVLAFTTTRAVRAFADDVRTDYPAVATALVQLADDTDRRPIDEWDIPNVGTEHGALFRDWEARCRRRSVLLEPLGDLLSTLWAAKDAGVIHARRALDVLADAELLLPGVDAALRPALTAYSGGAA